MLGNGSVKYLCADIYQTVLLPAWEIIAKEENEGGKCQTGKNVMEICGIVMHFSFFYFEFLSCGSL